MDVRLNSVRSKSVVAALLLLAAARAEIPRKQPIRSTVEDEFGGCSFTRDQPRFQQILARLTLENAGTADTLINDALIRALRKRLMVAECQIILSEGVPCTSGTVDLPCAEPVHVCVSSTPGEDSGPSARTVLTNDVYDAIAFESCDSNGDGLVDVLDGDMSTLVCGQVLEVDTAVQTMVKQGGCTAVCDVDALLTTNGGNSTSSLSTGSFPSSPSSSSSSSSCLSFDLTVNVATAQAAVGLQGELVSDAVDSTVAASLGGFGSSPSEPLAFSVVESTIVEAVGFGFFPPPPPPPPPIMDLASSTDTNDSNDSTDAKSPKPELVYGEWTACYPSCGDGISTRTVTCVDEDGAVLPLGDCPGGLRAESSRACTTPCELPHWQYGPWQTCNRRCGTGQSTRTAVCVSDGVTKCSPDAKQPTNRECNTVPCEVFAWVQSTWSTCSAPCGSGTQSRNVTCVGSDGSVAPQASCDASNMPAASRVCNSQSCDFCESNSCLGRGTCFDGKCQCDGRYSGGHCELHSSCQSGVVGADLSCCASGVLDSRGACCPAGSSVDGSGECCSGTVDACGVCNGSGKYVDIQGQCCAVVDADGVCCSSGLIDECGVCNGVGNTCNIVLGLNMRVPSDIVAGSTVQPASIDAYLDMVANMTGISADRISVGGVALAEGGSSLSIAPPSSGIGRKLLQDSTTPSTTSLLVQVEIAPDVNKPAEVPFSSAYFAQALPEASAKYGSDKFGVESVPIAARSGVCGNGICELGERPLEGVSASETGTSTATDTEKTGTCPEDCGLPSKACPGGCANGGACLPASGVCQCLGGYAGTSCRECAQGYSRNGDGSACIVNVADQGIISGSVLGANGEALVSGTTSGGTSAGVIVGAVFGAILGTALIIAIVLLIRRRRMYGTKSPQFVTNNKLYRDGDGPESSDASDLGLRKKYGLAPHAFDYSDSFHADQADRVDQIGVGQYHGNPMFVGADRYGGLGDGPGVYVYGSGNQQDDPEHRVMYMTHMNHTTHTAEEPTSSGQNSGFCRELFVKDPSPDRILMKAAGDGHGERQYSEEHSGYIKAVVAGDEMAHDDGDDEHEEIQADADAAQSLGLSSPGMDSRPDECASIGSERRMMFNAAYCIDGDDAGCDHEHEYPRTVVAPRQGDPAELNELDARRQKLDALRAAVRSLENSRAPSRETSFTGDDMVDVESIAGRSQPMPPAGIPGLDLRGMHVRKHAASSKNAAGPADPVKEPTSFFATVKRALTPPRFRRPVSATESNDGVSGAKDMSIERSSSMGSFTRVLNAVDDALGGREEQTSAKARQEPRMTVFDATRG